MLKSYSGRTFSQICQQSFWQHRHSEGKSVHFRQNIVSKTVIILNSSYICFFYTKNHFLTLRPWRSWRLGENSSFTYNKKTMQLIPVTHESLKKGAEILKSGGLVAFPTETVYGLGADAFNPQAVAKIFEVKNRPYFDPLIIHIADIKTLENTANLSQLNEEIRKKIFLLAENLWPGPLSIILPKNERIPGIVTAGLQTAAIRLPGNDTARKLISLSTGAIAAPSANPFGFLSPTKAEHVLNGLGGKIDFILDGGQTKIGIESTVLDVTDGNFKILRPGGTAREAIENLIGPIQKTENKEKESEKNEHGLASPGMIKSHYAPKNALTIFDREEILNHQNNANRAGEFSSLYTARQKAAFLFFDGAARDAWLQTEKTLKEAVIKVLSEKGDLLEAASRLFETLHEIDSCGVTHIFAQLAPQSGLGEAINDRLRRAAAVK